MTLKTLTCLLAGLVLTGSAVSAADSLVAGGVPEAEIAIDCTATKECPVEFAAEELQRWIEAISGAKLPVVATPSGKAKLVIHIGTPALSETIRRIAREEDKKAIGTSDGFAIRRDGTNIYIYGNIPKGALNGVYQFLNDNTDIVFVRPAEAETGFGTVYTKTPDLPLKQADLCRVPAFPFCRYFTANVPDVQLWQVRLMNRSNVNRRVVLQADALRRNPRKKPPFPRYREWGVNIYGGAHSFNVIMPVSKVSKEHPDIYPQIPGKDGKLAYKWNNRFDTFLCWTSDTALEQFMEYFRKEVEESVKEGCAFIELPHGDTDQVCQCENCAKDIVVDGKIISRYADVQGKNPDVPAHMADHQSTLYYLFINRVAREIAKTHPGLRLRGMAYWITRMAPAVKLEPNIDIFWAPYKKTLRLPMTDPRLRIDRYNYPETFEKWCKVLHPDARYQLYEYHFCTQPELMPNPVSDVIAEDLRFYQKEGRTNGIYFDANGWDNDRKFTDSGVTWTRANTYDSSAMERWVTSRLMWDPNLDPEVLRDEFCRRAFHSAAPEMRAFYRLFRDGWTINQGFLAWNDGAPHCMDNYIHLFGNGKKATELLEAALKKADNASSKVLIQRQYDAFVMAGGTKLNIHNQ